MASLWFPLYHLTKAGKDRHTSAPGGLCSPHHANSLGCRGPALSGNAMLLMEENVIIEHNYSVSYSVITLTVFNIEQIPKLNGMETPPNRTESELLRTCLSTWGYHRTTVSHSPALWKIPSSTQCPHPRRDALQPSSPQSHRPGLSNLPHAPKSTASPTSDHCPPMVHILDLFPALIPTSHRLCLSNLPHPLPKIHSSPTSETLITLLLGFYNFQLVFLLPEMPPHYKWILTQHFSVAAHCWGQILCSALWVLVIWPLTPCLASPPDICLRPLCFSRSGRATQILESQFSQLWMLFFAWNAFFSHLI